MTPTQCGETTRLVHRYFNDAGQFTHTTTTRAMCTRRPGHDQRDDRGHYDAETQMSWGAGKRSLGGRRRR